jgi:FG-GAP repeat
MSDTTAHQQFGTSVAMTRDYFLIGAPATYPSNGAAYVFGDPWASAFIELAVLHDTSVSTRFGEAVAANNDSLAVASSSAGVCDVFGSDHGIFLRKSVLLGDAGSSFGSSVALTGDELIVGAIGTSATADGDAFVFQNDRIFADGFD